MNNSNLLYKVEVPDIKFYYQISKDEYNKIVKSCNNKWKAKDNCLIYLERDLDLLYEAIIMFAKEIWNDCGVNITSRKTISRLTLLIFQVNYFGYCGFNIPILNGALENYFSPSGAMCLLWSFNTNTCSSM
jgi:DNA polymerase type B, organellar and viral